ncbi:MAG: glycosyltransferase family 4 protein [Campylobacteraceae bacterium]|nr:glycosyltransferase family 4 protein [Campylobacteraceae bacterium]
MLTINYKTRNSLISKLLENENIKEVKKPSFFSKLFGNKEFADIYFHSGNLDANAIENIKKAKKVFVNSQTAHHELLKNFQENLDKVEVLYPSVNIEYKKPKEVKQAFCQEQEIDPKKKIIFFTAKNFNNSGVKEFLSIVLQLSSENFIAVIEGDKKQITSLKFQLSKINTEDKIILLDDYKNKDDLFLASDIFILPTSSKNFASNILKAMYCKCAVFVTATNPAKEVVDIFSMMESPDDRSMQFKVEALLQNKNDLKLIKKQNRKIAKEYSLENALAKVEKSISTL